MRKSRQIVYIVIIVNIYYYNIFIMVRIKSKNSEYFDDLLIFLDELKDLFILLNEKPIIYGSVAYLYYTHDNEMNINDIDILIPESFFPIIRNYVKNTDILRYEDTSYNSLKVFKGKYKIAFDSIDHYYSNLINDFSEVEINNIPFKIIPFDSLIEVYKRWIDTIPFKFEAYTKKLLKLESARNK